MDDSPHCSWQAHAAPQSKVSVLIGRRVSLAATSGCMATASRPVLSFGHGDLSVRSALEPVEQRKVPRSRPLPSPIPFG